MSTTLPPEVIAEIVRRLAHAFPVIGCHFATDALVSSHDIANMLCGLDADALDEVGMLFRMGVLKESSRPNSCAQAEMLRFLEQHGETWYLARLELVRAALRKGLARAEEAEEES